MEKNNKTVTVTLNDKMKEVNCDILKLANTIWNKEGEKYTEEEMFNFGFEKKKI